MKRIIYNHKTNEVLSIAQTQELAHTLAETLSYIANGNALYGLFGIRLVDLSELRSTEDGRQAWEAMISKL